MICYKVQESICSESGVENPLPIFCIKLCPLVHEYEDMHAYLNNVETFEEISFEQTVHPGFFRSAVTWCRSVCLACPDIEQCQTTKKIFGGSKCGCKDKVLTLIEECPKKVFCGEVLRNWKFFRYAIGGEAYLKMDEDKQ